ncbi:MAG: glycosyltransferase family 2 protein [Oscillospiraceae bacterium]|nr:glycosyltransferase family 2 protein [Oscillospiraceae bacterium]
MKNRLLSIVIPAFNEEENIQNTAAVVQGIMDGAQIPYELVFVSDGSRDATFSKVLALAEADSRIRGLEFSRNFGKEAAIFAGLSAVKGGCAVVMDCDLQHPPHTIVEMYRLWEQGYEIVEGVKNTRGKESVFHKLFAGSFYKILSSLTGMDMENTSDFKLLDKSVIDVLLDMSERKTFFRAMSFWVGFKSCQVHYDVQERAFGTTKWSFFKLAKYAVSNIVSFSTKPLNIVNYMGGISIFIGLILGIQTLVKWFSGHALEGFTTVILLLLLLGGGILLGLGILGSYLSAIYQEVKARPRYIVRLDTDKMLKRDLDK